MQSLGLDIVMPPFLEHRRQFTTQESNKSRCVTKIRWVVEAVNRRIKEFKYFANTVQNSSLMYLQDDLSIACALINCYRPPIATSKPEDVEMGREMRSLITKKNQIETVKLQQTSPMKNRLSSIPAAERKQLVEAALSMGNDWSHRCHRWFSNTIGRGDRRHHFG